MKNQSMTKTGLKSGSGQKYGNLQSSQTNMQNSSSNSLQKQHGYTVWTVNVDLSKVAPRQSSPPPNPK